MIPSNFFDQLRMMFNTTTTTTMNRTDTLAKNYMYINRNKISHSLICSICLNPLIDPQIHILCENSFCNDCIRKLRHCPSCQTSITELNDLQMSSDVLRNMLNELQVQCNICKQNLCRGDFDNHIRTNCLQQSLITPEEENKSHTNEQHMEKYLSNLYNRVHKLENESYELQKVIFLFLFVLSTIGIIHFFGTIFAYVIHSFLSIVLMIWLPLILKFLFDFSPLMILLRLIFISLYFFIFCYKKDPSDRNILTVIICLVITIFNSAIFILYLLIYHLNILVLLFLVMIMMKYFYFTKTKSIL